jgi:hypothetical protein
MKNNPRRERYNVSLPVEKHNILFLWIFRSTEEKYTAIHIFFHVGGVAKHSLSVQKAYVCIIVQLVMISFKTINQYQWFVMVFIRKSMLFNVSVSVFTKLYSNNLMVILYFFFLKPQVIISIEYFTKKLLFRHDISYTCKIIFLFLC